MVSALGWPSHLFLDADFSPSQGKDEHVTKDNETGAGETEPADSAADFAGAADEPTDEYYVLPVGAEGPEGPGSPLLSADESLVRLSAREAALEAELAEVKKALQDLREAVLTACYESPTVEIVTYGGAVPEMLSGWLIEPERMRKALGIKTKMGFMEFVRHVLRFRSSGSGAEF